MAFEAPLERAEVLTAWQCVGCGKLEAPQQCIGVCRDRKVRLVQAEVHEQVQAELEAVRARLAAIESLVRRFAGARPREGRWEGSYRALLEALAAALAAEPEHPAKG